MPSSRQGSIRLFRLAGIDVFLHWSWFLVAVYGIQSRSGRYSSLAWSVLEYLALFLIVLLHEFGHALACRQVGGQANQILLWPFGGVAYVDPPQRPGATLWSIAAGPLVNVVLYPILLGLILLGRSFGWPGAMPDLYRLLREVLRIDVYLFVFNILPIYPLDGGQILRSLLWFPLGRARSLMVATIFGFVGIVGFIGLAFWSKSSWLGIIAIYLLMICWGGLRHAQELLRFAKLPRRDGYVCPACKTSPPIGDFWKCGHCGQAFDIFQTQGVCPNCSTRFAETKCLDCSAVHPISEWYAPAMSVSSTFASEAGNKRS
jgi:Zn-dependent protease